MDVKIDRLTEADIDGAIKVWNEVVEDGMAFPQTETLDRESGRAFFGSQTYVGVATRADGKVVGVYILHPNNVGRCGHICNASYAVARDARGLHVGEKLVRHCMSTAKEVGFRILQFNAVVATNAAALGLYRKLGFSQLGTIPQGFRAKDGEYLDIIPHYITL